MQTVSETFAGTITVNRQMRLALPRMAMSLLIMSYLVADGVLISRFVGTTALSALSMSYPLTALLIAASQMSSLLKEPGLPNVPVSKSLE